MTAARAVELEPADLNRAIIRVARRHRYLAGLLLDDLALHPGQEHVLFALWNRPPVDQPPSQRELAQELGIEPPTLHRSLTSMERAGYVRRTPSERDRRVICVQLTAAGRALRPEVEAVWAELERWTVGSLSDRDRQTLARLLRLVAENLAVGRDSGC